MKITKMSSKMHSLCRLFIKKKIHSRFGYACNAQFFINYMVSRVIDCQPGYKIFTYTGMKSSHYVQTSDTFN